MLPDIHKHDSGKIHIRVRDSRSEHVRGLVEVLGKRGRDVISDSTLPVELYHDYYNAITQTLETPRATIPMETIDYIVRQVTTHQRATGTAKSCEITKTLLISSGVNSVIELLDDVDVQRQVSLTSRQLPLSCRVDYMISRKKQKVVVAEATSDGVEAGKLHVSATLANKENGQDGDIYGILTGFRSWRFMKRSQDIFETELCEVSQKAAELRKSVTAVAEKIYYLLKGC